MRRLVAMALGVAFALSLLAPATASAAPPTNDNIANATTVSTLPYTETVDITDATRPSGETGSVCGWPDHTIWYKLAPTITGPVTVTLTNLSFSSPLISILWFWNTYPQQVTCGTEAVTFTPTADKTYFIKVGSADYMPGGTLTITFTGAPAPANDSIANATTVSGFPFTDSVDMRPATSESGEPAYCERGIHTIWYTFTPTWPGTIRAVGLDMWDPTLTIYRAAGPGFGNLSYVTCQNIDPVTFDVDAGTTYYVQASDWYTGGSTLRLRLSFTPAPDTVPPEVTFGAHPATYTLDETVSISCGATDALGVVATTCADTNRPAWELGPGSYVLSATATDAAGNIGTGTTTFDVLAPDYPAMKALTGQLVEKAGVAAQLVGYLDAASRAEARDNPRAEAGSLDSYRSLLRAQSGKSVAPAAADALTAFSSAL